MDERAYTTPLDDPYTADPADVEKNKVMGILAYLGILVLVPLLTAKQSRFAMFHANQGLILFIGWIALWIVGMIPIIGWLVIFGYLFMLLLMVVGIINAAGGKMKPLPVIGGFTLIK